MRGIKPTTAIQVSEHHTNVQFSNAFRLTFKEFVPQHEIEDPAMRDTSIVVEKQKTFNRMVTEVYQKNTIEFTPAQVKL